MYTTANVPNSNMVVELQMTDERFMKLRKRRKNIRRSENHTTPEEQRRKDIEYKNESVINFLLGAWKPGPDVLK